MLETIVLSILGILAMGILVKQQLDILFKGLLEEDEEDL